VRGDLFVWGYYGGLSSFTPQQIKYGSVAPVADIQISNKEFAVISTQDGQLYSWG
jgi:alpha-tubulin suppressor-like RCC1 family protein